MIERKNTGLIPLKKLRIHRHNIDPNRYHSPDSTQYHKIYGQIEAFNNCLWKSLAENEKHYYDGQRIILIEENHELILDTESTYIKGIRGIQQYIKRLIRNNDHECGQAVKKWRAG